MLTRPKIRMVLHQVPTNWRVFVSPGALVKHEGRLYINIHSQINAKPDQYFIVQVTQLEQEVLVNMGTVPKDLHIPEIDNGKVIKDHFMPVVTDEFRRADNF